jgi:diacylglycerol O-acyltransferase / wax synthase
LKRLGGWDAMLLYSETPNVHMHTIKVAVVDAAHLRGEYDFDRFRRTVRRRMHTLEPLRYQLVDVPLKLHHPMWLENVKVDLDYHLRRARVASPGGRRELNELIGQIASTPLDRGRPLWEFHFVEGMADDRFAVVCKVHHTLADGVASANLLARAMDPVAPDDEDAYPTDPPPSAAALLRAAALDHAKQLGKLPGLMKHTAEGIGRVRRRSRERDNLPELARNFHPPKTFINHVVSPTRKFATATLALADVKETKGLLGVSINDLVMAVAAGALRELRLRYDGHSNDPILATVAVSTDASPDRITGNELNGLFMSLPVHIDDALERVRLTHLATGVAKENYNLLGPALPGRWAAFLPPALAPWAFRKIARRDAPNALYNVPVSNVPGPRERGRIADAPISEIYSVGPVMAGCGINITVWSYVDQLNISVISDDLTVNDPHEVTDAMVDAFSEIRTAAGQSGSLTEVATAMAPASAP